MSLLETCVWSNQVFLTLHNGHLALQRSPYSPNFPHKVNFLLQVGSDLTPEEVQAISDHSKKYGHVSHVVKLDWLRQCFRERKLLPVGSNYIMKPSVLLQSLRAKSKSLPSKEISNAQNLQVCLSFFYFPTSISCWGSCSCFCCYRWKYISSGCFMHWPYQAIYNLFENFWSRIELCFIVMMHYCLNPNFKIPPRVAATCQKFQAVAPLSCRI